MRGLKRDILDAMEGIFLSPESDNRTSYASKGKMEGNRAIILDRDGVIIKDRRPVDFKLEPELIDGAVEAVKGFREMGYSIAVATNQGAIGMGLIDHGDLVHTMSRIREMFHPVSPWDRAYYSPFFPGSEMKEYDTGHLDRKPGPGMLLRAAHDLNLDLSSSIMIGDHLKDIEAAHNAGCRGILVTTGRGRRQIRSIVTRNIVPGDPGYPDAIVQDIRAALDLLKEGFR